MYEDADIPVSASQAAACSTASGKSPTAADIFVALSSSRPGTCRLRWVALSRRLNTSSSTGRA